MITINKLSIILFSLFTGTVHANKLILDVNGNIPEKKQIIAAEEVQTKKDIDLLSVSVRTVFHENIKSVGQATEYILETIGYKLVVSYPAPSDAILLASKPIPPIARIHRTMPIVDAIQLMIGLENYVIIDHGHKLVSFSKKER